MRHSERHEESLWLLAAFAGAVILLCVIAAFVLDVLQGLGVIHG